MLDRRAWIATVASLLGAGCLSRTTGSTRTTETETPTPTPMEVGTLSEDTSTDTRSTEQTTVESTVTVSLTIENHGNRSRVGSVKIVHSEVPTCAWADQTEYECEAVPEYECDQPAEETVALDTSFDLDAGEQRAFGSAEMAITKGDTNRFDKYGVEVETDSGAVGELDGLEPGGTVYTGREMASGHPWRVAARHYQIRAFLTDDNAVEIFVRADK